MDSKQEIGSNALIFNDKGEFLLVKRSDDDEYFPGSWELPGGGVLDSETPQESLQREVLEECGLKVSVSYPLGVHVFHLPDNTTKVSEITFFCELEDQNQQVVLSHEHSNSRWITKGDVQHLDLSEYIQHVIIDGLENPLLKNL